MLLQSCILVYILCLTCSWGGLCKPPFETSFFIPSNYIKQWSNTSPFHVGSINFTKCMGYSERNHGAVLLRHQWLFWLIAVIVDTMGRFSTRVQATLQRSLWDQSQLLAPPHLTVLLHVMSPRVPLVTYAPGGTAATAMKAWTHALLLSPHVVLMPLQQSCNLRDQLLN